MPIEPIGHVMPIGRLALRFFAVCAWCGLGSGLAEVAVIVLRKEAVDLNRFFWMSRHFVWLIPATNLLFFLVLGAISFPVILVRRDRGTAWVTRALCVFTVLPPVWAATPRIFAPASFVLAAGIAARLAPIMEARRNRVMRFVTATLPVLATAFLILAAGSWAKTPIKEWRRQSYPLPPPGSPSMILIVLDTVAAGHLSLHGYHRPTSPTLDALARRAIQFPRARAAASWTLPSHASIFTGKWPHELSAGWLTPLDAAHATLAEFLGSRGYATAAVVANMFYCGADSGLARGFDRYDDYVFPQWSAFKMAAIVARPLEGLRSIDNFLRQRLYTTWFQPLILRFDAGNRKPASVVNRQFLAWLNDRRQPERPFFAFLNYFDAHYPYRIEQGAIHRFGLRPRTEREIDIIENWRTVDKSGLSPREIAFVRDSYDDCIANLDEQVGRLIDQLERMGVRERTWLIITSDHGESLGEHPGVFGHGVSLYETEVHVPLLIVPPGDMKAPRAVAEVVSLRDLAATVVDVLGLAPAAPFPGHSLARFWDDRSAPAAAEVLSEVVPTDPLASDPYRALADRRAQAALADSEWTYLYKERDPRDELFNSRDDPNELHNRAQSSEDNAIAHRMRQRLDAATGGPLTADRFNP